MLNNHINLTTQEAVAHMNKNYDEDTRLFDAIYDQILAMSVTDPEIRKISRAKGAFLRSGLMRDLGSWLYWARKP